MCRGEGVERGMLVPATITEQTKTFRSTNKAHGKLTGVNLVSNICMDNNASTKNIRIIRYLYLGIIACITVLNVTCNIV